MTVAVIDYNMGNIGSVVNACELIGSSVFVANKPNKLTEADKIILPGVGAFGDGISNLLRFGWVESLEEEIRRKGKPFLGICLGMQLLATTGTENGLHEGIGWIEGVSDVLDIKDTDLRLPHIGWNDVKIINHGKLFKDIDDNSDFYFLHSYHLVPKNKNIITSVCEYGVQFSASLQFGNIYATQFHPEKSQKSGLSFLQNFLNL